MTSAKMASASVNATPINITVCICPEASGLRPIASSALPTTSPIQMPGPMTPKPTASAMPIIFADSMSILFLIPD